MTFLDAQGNLVRCHGCHFPLGYAMEKVGWLDMRYAHVFEPGAHLTGHYGAALLVCPDCGRIQLMARDLCLPQS